MEKITLNVEKMFCEECSLALRRFIGHMEGVESIDVEEGKVAITFDEAKITGEELSRITRDNIEKLGYKTDILSKGNGSNNRWYRLIVGPFDTSDEVLTYKDKITIAKTDCISVLLLVRLSGFADIVFVH